MEIYLRRLVSRLFLLGAAAAVAGLYIGFTGGFDKLATLLAIAGSIVAVVFGIAVYLMRDPE